MKQVISLSQERPSFLSRLGYVNWGLAFVVCMAAALGFVLLYSAAGGKMSPWADVQTVRFGLAFLIMIVTAMISPRVWYGLAYWMWAGSVALLVIVEFVGTLGGGAERWIDLGLFRLQPSEVMKITLVVVLARYFHSVQFEQVRRAHIQ